MGGVDDTMENSRRRNTTTLHKGNIFNMIDHQINPINNHKLRRIEGKIKWRKQKKLQYMRKPKKIIQLRRLIKSR